GLSGSPPRRSACPLIPVICGWSRRSITVRPGAGRGSGCSSPPSMTAAVTASRVTPSRTSARAWTGSRPAPSPIPRTGTPAPGGPLSCEASRSAWTAGPSITEGQREEQGNHAVWLATPGEEPHPCELRRTSRTTPALSVPLKARHARTSRPEPRTAQRIGYNVAHEYPAFDPLRRPAIGAPAAPRRRRHRLQRLIARAAADRRGPADGRPPGRDL